VVPVRRSPRVPIRRAPVGRPLSGPRLPGRSGRGGDACRARDRGCRSVAVAGACHDTRAGGGVWGMRARLSVFRGCARPGEASRWSTHGADTRVRSPSRACAEPGCYAGEPVDVRVRAAPCPASRSRARLHRCSERPRERRALSMRASDWPCSPLLPRAEGRSARPRRAGCLASRVRPGAADGENDATV